MSKVTLKFGGITSPIAANQVAAIMRLLEYAYAIFSLLIYSGPLVALTSKGATSQFMISQTTRSLSIVLAVSLIPIFLWQIKAFLSLLLRSKLLFLIILIVFASVLVSDAPDQTLLRLRGFATMTIFVIYFAMRFEPQEQLKIIAWVLGIGAVASLIAGLFFREYAIVGANLDLVGTAYESQESEHEGVWKGLYGHKNALSRMMILSTITFLLLALDRSKYRLLMWTGVVLSVILVILSTSKTGFASLPPLILLLPFLRSLQRKATATRSFTRIAGIILVAIIGIVLAANTETLLSASGRDITLTGRTDLWEAVVNKISEQPLGHGYGTFWSTTLAYEVWSIVGWQPAHSHNGFLDVCLDIGLVGLGLILLNTVILWFRAVKWARVQGDNQSLWVLLFLIYLLFSNLTESSFFQQYSLWIYYVAVSISMPQLKLVNITIKRHSRREMLREER